MEGEAAYRLQGEQPGGQGGGCSVEGHLSEIMPDVAMATASLGQLQLAEAQESLQLDLGDGPGHAIGAAGGGIGIGLGMQVCEIVLLIIID